MKLRKELIAQKYGNVSNMCRELQITKSVVYAVLANKTGCFHNNSKQHKAYKRLIEIGVLDTSIEEGNGARGLRQ